MEASVRFMPLLAFTLPRAKPMRAVASSRGAPARWFRVSASENISSASLCTRMASSRMRLWRAMKWRSHSSTMGSASSRPLRSSSMDDSSMSPPSL